MKRAFFAAALCAGLTALAASRPALAVHEGESEAGVAAVAEALTADDQGESQRDVSLTSEIRRGLVGDDSLSTEAKNIKIITVDGQVALKGRVLSDEEIGKVDRMARDIAGDRNVDNQLRIKGR